MHTAARRSSSLSGILDSQLNATAGVARTLVFPPSDHGARVKNEQRKTNKKKESLRRCKSSPEKKLSKQSLKMSSDAWKCAWNKERGYVADSVAEQQPITNQPQLSYFAYLGNNHLGKGRYQAASGNTAAIINLGNGIFAQNRSPSMTNTEEQVTHGNDVHKSVPIKHDTATLLECCSCLCCVKAIFYHCTKDRDFERNWADQPCSCETGTDCGARWGILGMFSVFLPCLVCYPIIKVCCKFPFNLTKNT